MPGGRPKFTPAMGFPERYDALRGRPPRHGMAKRIEEILG